MTDNVLLSVEQLSLTLPAPGGRVEALSDVSFTVRKGETFALVGESGCGKSLTASAIMQLLPAGASVPKGRIVFDGTDLLKLTEGGMRPYRGGRIAFIFQEPSSALDPVMTAGDQISEMILTHRTLSREAAHAEAVDWIRRVGLPDPERTALKFPHELSGGQKQRIMIAIALSARPQLVIADEPTTALDVTVQAQILNLLDELRRTEGLTLILITHDLAVVKAHADRLALMYAGETVECATTAEFFAAPKHPYAAALLAALPKSGRTEPLTPIEGTVPTLSALPHGCRFAPRCPLALEACRAGKPAVVKVAPDHLCRCLRAGEKAPVQTVRPAASASPDAGKPLLTIENLRVTFGSRGFWRRKPAMTAVDGVSLSLAAGETLALVGESGSGKTTTALAALGLLGRGAEVTGRVRLEGKDVLPPVPGSERHLRQCAQIIFQDPFASLDPRMTVLETLTEGMLTLRPEWDAVERRRRALALLDAVGLPQDAAGRLPHAFSGGQCQRIAVARALSVEPKLIVCDEPTSALDVSVQAQILNLLNELQEARGLAYLFITHNFAVVEHMADRIVVMRRGRIEEEGSAADVLGHPKADYTKTLLASVPRL